MARVLFGGGISGIVGKVGGSIFQGGRTGNVLRNWCRPTNSRTPAQVVSRQQFGDATRAWAGLSTTDKLAWGSYGGGHYVSDPFIRSRPMSGMEAYVRNATKLQRWSIPISMWDLIPGPSGYHPDLQDYIDIMVQQGFTNDSEVLDALDQCFYEMDVLGLLDDNFTLLPMVGQDLNAARISIAELGTGPSQWASVNLDLSDYVRYGVARGISGNGVDERLYQYQTFNSYTQPIAMFIRRRLADAEAGTRYLGAADDGTNSVSLEFNNTTPQYRGYLGGSSGVIKAAEVGTCSLCVASYALNNLILYRDGIQVGTQAGRATQTLPAYNFNLCCGNLSGVPSGFTTSTIQMFAVFSATSAAVVAAAITSLERLHENLCAISA